MSIKNLINQKTNILGVVSIALLTSLATVFFTNFLQGQYLGSVEQRTQPASIALAPSGILDCEQGVYSPVQRLCVDQATFDAEMKRLFAALGLNSKAYEQQ